MVINIISAIDDEAGFLHLNCEDVQEWMKVQVRHNLKANKCTSMK